MDALGLRDICLHCVQTVADIPLLYLIGFLTVILVGLFVLVCENNLALSSFPQANTLR